MGCLDFLVSEGFFTADELNEALVYLQDGWPEPSADVARGKPAPDLFIYAAQKMGVPASECLVFEDSLLGIEAARSAGMGAVLVKAERRHQ